jgi:hypothetical protein
MATVVTAYYEIKSKFPSSRYWEWIKNFCTIPFNVVIFTSPDLVEKFKQMRMQLPRQTVIVPLALEQFHHYQFIEQYRKHYAMDSNKSHSPELYMIWAEKVKFVMQAIHINPFKTDKFIWCDIGVVRQTQFLANYRTFPRADKMSDKMNFLLLEKFTKQDRIGKNGIPGQTYGTIRLGGGIHGGDIKSWEKYDKLWDSTLQRYFSVGLFAGQDQCIMGTIYLEHPELFNIIIPSRKQQDGDPWFYLLLHFA